MIYAITCNEAENGYYEQATKIGFWERNFSNPKY
jgi:hypothetical protein